MALQIDRVLLEPPSDSELAFGIAFAGSSAAFLAWAVSAVRLKNCLLICLIHKSHHYWMEPDHGCSGKQIRRCVRMGRYPTCQLFSRIYVSVRLLFGSVSLLTKDRPRPLSSERHDRYPVRNGKSVVASFRRLTLKAHDAVTWYRSAGMNGITIPVPSEPSEGEDTLNGSLSPTSFEDDPPWYSLGVPLGTDTFLNPDGPGDPAPFRGTGSPRIHRRFGNSTGFESVLSDSSAIRYLKRRLHVDLSDYTEYLGGLALVVPDPILRSVQHFLIPGQSVDGPEQVVYRLVSRPGQSNLAGLRHMAISTMQKEGSKTPC